MRFLAPSPALLCAMFAVLVTAGTAQNKIAVQSGNSVTFYSQDSLQAALNGAQNGDVVYLPGGMFTGDFTLNKSIQLIGAGYSPDSSLATSTTTFGGTFYLTANSSNSYITGLSIAGPVYCPALSYPILSNIVIHRCYLQSGFGHSGNYAWHSNSSNLILDECISGTVQFNNAQNCLIRNCILTSQVWTARNASLQSSIFLYMGPTNIYQCSGCTIQGNIFYDNLMNLQGTTSAFATVTRNCFVDDLVDFTYVSAFDNVFGATATQLFEAYTAPFDFMDDFHLPPGSPALGAGPTGSDCGIYGGPSPWKPGGVPSNPHIQQQFIGTTTNPQGDLPVQIKVAAQGQ